ncbi:class I SAM-dependent methyltransferase [Agromyces seonyuensis]|uniref:Methyltransferase n=1 Tax=Agromyces seonyuensis TaxID=2662446 RepID=A0A6I4NZ53_9MICO|nr:methyltransferase [Agromyces seonyuensis]MWB99568.1 methyltransferase [Agromyces seonyuensis]
MSSDHYFSASPASKADRRPLVVRLAGAERRLETASGIFSPDRVDLGTSVLLEDGPSAPESGAILDLGSGWGPITLTAALESPEATVWAVDVNERALDLVRRNAARLGLSNVNAATPEDVPADLSFRSIRSNPPIRVGKDVLHGMLRQWLPRLEPGGQAWLVVQKNLGSDSLHRWLAAEFADGYTVTREGSAKGFRLLVVTRDAD